MPSAAGKIAVDSGPIIALFDAGDGHHRHVLDFARRNRAPTVSPLAVITQAMYVPGPGIRILSPCGKSSKCS
jgi:hypothetical protein